MSQSSGASAPADLRCVRALAVAGVAVLLGVTGHVTAGGVLPGPGVVVPLVVMLAVVSAVLLGRPASYRTLLALVAGGQAAIHLVLTMVSGHAGDHAEAGAGALPHALQHLRDDLTGPHLVMAVGHLAAAAGVAGWLLLGERAVWWLVALLGRHAWARLVADWWLSRPTSGPGAAGTPGWSAALLRVRRVAAAGPVGRRGPPGPLRAPTTALPA
ncbi:hypothetical protein GCM10023340_43720 [Nocardioides marinquilinus]|uniref:MFS transporter n=1 Tax=Nocardioides marinquilinus TaxID=1210400 RepID=A0ABP9Q506_9ACTN